MSRKQHKKTYNLAERKEVMELMKQLYGDVTDDSLASTTGKKGADLAGSVVELPPSTEKLLLQDEQ